MPRVRRRRPIAKGISPMMMLYLETGHWFGELNEVSNPQAPTDEHARLAWEIVREEMLANETVDVKTVKTREPGKRPWAWWRFDAPEPFERSAAHTWDENEAAKLAYLKRHGLLIEAERRALPGE